MAPAIEYTSSYSHKFRISDFGFRIFSAGNGQVTGACRPRLGRGGLESGVSPHPVSEPDRGQYVSGSRVALHRADKSEIRNPKSEIPRGLWRGIPNS